MRKIFCNKNLFLGGNNISKPTLYDTKTVDFRFSCHFVQILANKVLKFFKKSSL